MAQRNLHLVTRSFEVKRKEQSTDLLKQTNIGDLQITVTLHRTLNSCQGVISESGLIDKTEADILEGLREQGVTAQDASQ